MQKDFDAIKYIKNKLVEYQEAGDEVYKIKYLHLYDDIQFEELKHVFAIMHSNFNRLLKYMDQRLKYGHYSAHESRQLIYWIEEYENVYVALKKSGFSFNLSPEYDERLEYSKHFLQNSGGSPIPKDLEKMVIDEVEPIFKLNTIASVPTPSGKGFYPLQMIGNGSYATVYQYKDEYYDKIYAVKKANGDLRPDEYQRFRIEFDQMKQLNSPYVVEVFRFDEDSNQYTMEYLDETLKEYITRKNNTISSDERIGIVRQVLKFR